MKLLIITALIAVCGAAKLDRTYLPPPSANTAGGSQDSLQTPLIKSSSGEGETSSDLPNGSYTNNFQGVVVDAAAAGVRASTDGDQSGLGGPRDTYGSTNSKVGDAAFRGSVAGFRNTQTFGSSGLNGQGVEINAGQNFGAFESNSERPQAHKDRNSNIISYANDVSSDNYSYGFESDNGIAVGENGVASNGIQAQGGYSYKGDDGQVYKVTYVADERGYRPQGAHLPTPPPIPKEILESLEQNAKEEAAGIVDDGSYDAQKYNAEGDYTHHNGGNNQYNGAQLSQISKRPESDATASSTFINQNNQAYGKPGQLGNTTPNFNGQFNQFGVANAFGSNVPSTNNGLTQSQLNKQPTETLSGHQQSSNTGFQSSGHYGQNSGTQLTSQYQSSVGSQSSQFGAQSNQQVQSTQSTQLESQVNQQLLDNQFEPQSSQIGYQQGSATQFGGQFSQVGPTQGNQVGSASQIGTQDTKPSVGQIHSAPFNYQSNQGTQFGNHGYKPQYNSNNQGHSQGSNRPSFGSFGSNKPSSIGQGQNNVTSTISDNGDRVPNTNNQFGAEYLPPFIHNDKQSQNKPETNEVNSFQQSNRDETAPELIPLQGQNQQLSSTAAASLGPVASGPQPAKPLNTFENQPERPNQFNYNSNSQLTSNGQSKPNYSQNNGAYAQALPLVSGSKPTAVPETELTTPLETYQTPVTSPGLQFNSQSASSFGNFGSQSSNNPTQPQNGFNNNFSSQQPTGQALAPSFPDSRPQGTTQFGFSSPSPSVFAVTPEPVSNKDKPQYSQNSFETNNQNMNGYYSTQKPSFIQGPHDSYYYNQPSKPFGTPAARPQGSRFPSSPSYQSNSVISNNQQVSLPSSITLPNSSTLNSVAPTSSSNFGQSQGSLSTNYYNGITQASISPFPSASPTTSAQYDMTQSVPIINQPAIQRQPNRPPFSQQQSAVPSFPSKPLNTFGQGPSTSFTQIQSDQSSLTNNGQSSIVQSFPSKPVSTSGQIPQNAFTQNQIELGQTSSTNNEQQQTPEITPEKESLPNQQYQGTIYEYNKPPEVLPAPEQTDSSSSSSDSMKFSSKPQENLVPNTPELKPQFGTQQAQTGQYTFISQSQESILNQPQFGSQAYKPFASSSTTQTQFDQNNQPTFTQNSIQQNPQDSQNNLQPIKPNVSSFLATTQFSQNSQEGSVSRPQSGKPLTIDNQLSTNTQFGQNTQSVFGSQSSPQTSGSQFNAPLNKPFGSTSTHISTQHSAQTSQVQPFKPLETTGSTQGTLPIMPFGTSQTNQGFQGYPSSKPQFGTQLTQFTQSSQQTFGTPQISSQPARRPQADAPLKPVTNVPSSPGFESQKPQFGQNTQAYQGNRPTVSAFGQQSFPNTQFDSTASKPQFSIQTQSGQDQSSSPIKPTGSASSQAQFGPNSAQASSSVESQQQLQSTHSYKPFGALNQGSNYQAQNKPQFDQAPQSTQDTNSQVQFGVQPFNPFGSSETQGSQNKPQISQNKPFSAQQGTPCCQGSKDSSIAPLNLGKPSQAFAQTQSQFAGFQGAQGLITQSVAGKGEEFGGPRQPPSFDTQTGYHY